MTNPTIGTVAMGDTEALKRIAKILPGDAETDTLSTATARLNAAIDIASAALSRPVQEPVAYRPTYQQIKDTVQANVNRMHDAGESHVMMARWLSADLDKLYPPAAPQPAHGTSATDPAPAPNMPCPCTLIEQDEDCPVGYPSMICGVCEGKGHTTQEHVTALACEMIKIASDVGEPEDPFAAWESVSLIQSQHGQLRKTVEELKFALCSSDMTIKDRADQAARLILAATASEGSVDG